MLTLAESSGLTIFGILFFIMLSGMLTLVILIQKPKGGGLAGAFGGAGGSQQAVFGAKTGDFLTWVTVILFICFIGTAILLVYTTRWDANPDFSESATISQPLGGSTGTEGGVTPESPEDLVESLINEASGAATDAAAAATEAAAEAAEEATSETPNP
ncbi:MAG: preprotein translocase subunit SecG [Planctomycetota bacterium]|jgi:preprotein translocase subunit SecG